jgi:hypothetical protein
VTSQHPICTLCHLREEGVKRENGWEVLGGRRGWEGGGEGGKERRREGEREGGREGGKGGKGEVRVKA